MLVVQLRIFNVKMIIYIFLSKTSSAKKTGLPYYLLLVLHCTAAKKISITKKKLFVISILTYTSFISNYCPTVKAKTGEEVTKNRPSAGVVDKTLAEEYKVIIQ